MINKQKYNNSWIRFKYHFIILLHNIFFSIAETIIFYIFLITLIPINNTLKLIFCIIFVCAIRGVICFFKLGWINLNELLVVHKYTKNIGMRDVDISRMTEANIKNKIIDNLPAIYEILIKNNFDKVIFNTNIIFAREVPIILGIGNKDHIIKNLEMRRDVSFSYHSGQINIIRTRNKINTGLLLKTPWFTSVDKMKKVLTKKKYYKIVVTFDDNIKKKGTKKKEIKKESVKKVVIPKHNWLTTKYHFLLLLYNINFSITETVLVFYFLVIFLPINLRSKCTILIGAVITIRFIVWIYNRDSVNLDIFLNGNKCLEDESKQMFHASYVTDEEIRNRIMKNIPSVHKKIHNEKRNKIKFDTNFIFTQGILKSFGIKNKGNEIRHLKIGQEIILAFPFGQINIKRIKNKRNNSELLKYSWFASKKQMDKVFYKIYYYRITATFLRGWNIDNYI